MDPLNEPIDGNKRTMILENPRSARFSSKAVTFAVAREKPLIFANTSEWGEIIQRSLSESSTNGTVILSLQLMVPRSNLFLISGDRTFIFLSAADDDRPRMDVCLV